MVNTLSIMRMSGTCVIPGRSKYSRIFSCPDGITPNSGLTGLSILYIYIYIYIYNVCVCACVCVSACVCVCVFVCACVCIRGACKKHVFVYIFWTGRLYCTSAKMCMQMDVLVFLLLRWPLYVHFLLFFFCS